MRQTGLKLATLKYTSASITPEHEEQTMTPTDSSKILGNIKWHVVGLCETKENFREEGVVVYETGKSEDNPNALLINKNFTDNVEKK